MNKKFKYLLDPLFLFSLTTYAINKFLFLKFNFWNNNFFAYYLNDMLLIPVGVPIILFPSKLIKFRNIYSPPKLWEIIVPLIIWSVFFELIGPFYLKKGTSDFFDILAYTFGGLISWLIWNRKIN